MRRTRRHPGGRRTSRRALRLAVVGATLGLVGALTLVTAGLSTDDDGGEQLESVAQRPALPLGSPTPGYAGAEETALELATEFEAVERAPGEPCPEEDLEISWEEPATDFETGAHYAPVGPRPEGNRSANGILSCAGSDFDYAGFSIDWDDGRWSADLAPDFSYDAEPPDGAGGGGGNDDDARPPVDPTTPVDPPLDDPLEDPALPPIPSWDGPQVVIEQLDEAVTEAQDLLALELPRVWHGLFEDHQIEDLSTYEPQTSCSPDPKAGTYGFSRLILDAFHSTGTSGIGRGCDVGGRSEHKEGRAWDWSALVDDPRDAAAASRVIGWLLATDEDGNEYAMARRLGLMYIIYNHSIWRSYAPEQGWVGYSGPNPHTDHVHFSFSRAGGTGETSFWQVADLPDMSVVDFGPFTLLPSAGAVSETPDQPAVLARPGPGPQPSLPSGGPGSGGPRPGGGGSPAPAPPPPPAPTPTPTPTVPPLPPPPRPSLPVPVPTLPSLPLGGGGGGGGGLLPTCPPGTPLLPLPLDCLLPG